MTGVQLIFGTGINIVTSHVNGFWDRLSYHDRMMSLTGYIFTLGGSVISWHAILQSTIVLSTTAAKYMSIIEAMKETLWLKGLLVIFML